MAHTLTTLMSHENPSIARHARSLWAASRDGGKPMYSAAYAARDSAASMVTVSPRLADVAAWRALLGYARRALMPPIGKFGIVTINGAPRMLTQSGDTLSVDMATIGCSRRVSGGEFRA